MLQVYISYCMCTCTCMNVCACVRACVCLYMCAYASRLVNILQVVSIMSCSVTHSPYQPGDARLLRHCEAIDCSESGALCMVTSALSGRIWDGCLWVFNSPRGLNVDTTTSSPAACASADLSLPVETGRNVSKRVHLPVYLSVCLPIANCVTAVAVRSLASG